MSTYWKSPYREFTLAFRNPNHSTLKFERSLYLSRAKTSVNSSRYDWIDVSPDQSPPARSNTTIKSILKVPKQNSSLLDKDRDNGNSEETETFKKDKKKVTFGFHKNTVNGDDNECSSAQSNNNHKSQFKTMRKLSHSKLLEESALRRLNRLIGVAQSTSLPSVKGRSLFSPRHSADRSTRPVCYHNADLKCIRCIRKDVETEHTDKKNIDAKLESKANESFQLKSDSTGEKFKPSDDLDSSKENTDERLIQDPVITTDKENNCVDSLSVDKGGEKQHGNCESPKTSPVLNRRKSARLLPGRYLFTAGAIHINKLANPSAHTDSQETKASTETVDVIDLKNLPANVKNISGENSQHKRGANDSGRSNSSNRIPTVTPSSVFETESQPVKQNSETETTNIIDLKNLPANLKNINNIDKIGDNSQQKRGANDSGRSNSSQRIPTVLTSSALEVESQPMTHNCETKKETECKCGKKCKRGKTSKEKTSRIIDWLNDVNEKQTFKPSAASRFAVESQQIC